MVQSLTEEAFDKNACGAMHTKREEKALSHPRFGEQFAQALIENIIIRSFLVKL